MGIFHLKPSLLVLLYLTFKVSWLKLPELDLR